MNTGKSTAGKLTIALHFVKHRQQILVMASLLAGMIRHGCVVASRRLAPDTKSNGATAADQYDTVDY